MGTNKAACQILSAVLGVWIVSGALVEETKQVKPAFEDSKYLPSEFANTRQTQWIKPTFNASERLIKPQFVDSRRMIEVESNCPVWNTTFEHGIQKVFEKPFKKIHFSCHVGYHLVGNHTQVCTSDGQWIPPQRPRCVSTKCKNKPSIQNADVTLDSQEGDEGTVTCRNGYLSMDSRESYRIVCNKYGMWTTLSGSPIEPCEKVNCPVPPAVPNAVYHYEPYGVLDVRGHQHGGRTVRYSCIEGFEMVDDTIEPILTCKDGEWEGPIPTCVRPELCSPPRSINNGKWKPKSKTRAALNGQFPVGSEVSYVCFDTFKLVGTETLKCTADRLWSKIPPLCVPDSERPYFCRDIGFDKIENGYCKCERSDSNSLEKCQPFFGGTQVRCACDSGYKLMGYSLLTCTKHLLSNRVHWSNEPPYCIRDESKDMDAPIPDNRESILQPKVVNGTRVSTLVIVIASACSVLGVLLLIMVVVVFRRKKPRPRLFHPSVTPPPYSRVHNSVLDEHDRLALMAYADATRAHLPTYEEAVQGRGMGGYVGVVRGTNPPVPTATDYRPLPSIPPNLRAPGSLPGGGADNPNRHSTVTTSTMNRDGLSENFGSLDTVNVSMSDASTSVTVETFDSGTSNRSMSSQRATAGSIASSEDNLANDNAPLLDNSGETCEDNSSECSTPNLEQKDE